MTAGAWMVPRGRTTGGPGVEPNSRTRRESGLGIVLSVLFVLSWLGVFVTEWQSFTDGQRSHGAAVRAGDLAAHLLQSTLEHWRFEFLHLISFVVLAALYVHERGAESRDGDEETAASTGRIDASVGGPPPMAPSAPGRAWKLPDYRLQATNSLGRP